MGEAEMSYAGPNALQRAKLAIEVIEKRIQKIGLQGKTRFDYYWGWLCTFFFRRRVLL